MDTSDNRNESTTKNGGPNVTITQHTRSNSNDSISNRHNKPRRLSNDDDSPDKNDSYRSSEADTVIVEVHRSRNRKTHKRHARIIDSSDSESNDDPSTSEGDRRESNHKAAKRSHTDTKEHVRSVSPADARNSQNRKKSRPNRDASGRLHLQKVCDKGDYSKAKSLIQSGVDVNDRDYAGNTALHDAALKGHLDIVRLLLDNGAIIDIRSGVADLDTPLIDATSRGHVDVVQLLLERGADPRLLNAQGKAALDFLDDDDSETIRSLLKQYSNEKKDKEKRESEQGETDTVHELSYNQELSQPGTFPNSEQHGGAYQRGRMGIALRENKMESIADIGSGLGRRRGGARSHSIRNDLLWMDVTTKTGREQVYKKAADGDIQYVGRYLEEGWQPDGDCLVLAARHGHTDVVGLLLAFGVKPDSLNEDGVTAIHEAIGRGHIETIKLLLDSGADPCWKDKQGKSYLDLAKSAVGEDDDETILIENAINGDNGSSAKKQKNIESRTKSEREKSSSTGKQGSKKNTQGKLKQEEDDEKSTSKENQQKKDLKEKQQKEREEREEKEREERDRKRKEREEVEEKEKKKEQQRLQKEREEKERQEKERREKEREEMEKQRKLEEEEKALRLLEEEKQRKLEEENEEKRRQLELRKEEERRNKQQELAKQKSIMEAQKEKERKDREKQMLKNLEEQEKQRAAQEKNEREERMRKQREQEEVLKKQKELEAEQEAERKRAEKRKKELDERRQLPYALRTAIYRPRLLEEAEVYFPVVSRVLDDTEFFLDVQISLILGVSNLYELYPDLSKKLVTEEEKQRLWSVIGNWMGKNLSSKELAISGEAIIKDRLKEKMKFNEMSVFWLRCDEIKEILEKKWPDFNVILPHVTVELDTSSLPEQQPVKQLESAKSDTHKLNLPLKLQLKLQALQP